jgi:hypothetical protein
MMYADGIENISNVDISSVVISQVKDRYADLTEMDCKWLPSASCILILSNLVQSACSTPPT